MNMDFNKLRTVTGEALMVSMIKMLVFKKLKDKPGINENILKDKINTKPNEFYKPKQLDLQGQNNFNSFIENLVNRIFEERKNG